MRRPVLLLVVFWLAGCPANGPNPLVGVSFDRLDDRYEALLQEKRALAAQPAAARAAKEAEVEGRFAELATEARAAAAGAAEPATRVGLLRLAAVAGWQAEDAGREVMLASSRDGTQLCDASASAEPFAPRDCALLTVVPVLAAQDDLVERLEAEAGAPDRTSSARVERLGVLLGDYRNIKTAADRAFPKARSTGGLDAGVLDYLAQEQRALACTGDRFKVLAFQTGSAAQPIRAEAAAIGDALRAGLPSQLAGPCA